MALLLAACSSCGSSSSDATITITAPEKDQELTLANDDVEPTQDGLQYNVQATSTGLGAGTGVLLSIEGETDAALANVGRDGSILFSGVTLPPGKHAIRINATTGDVHSADDWTYTYKALFIRSPKDGAALGLIDDKNKQLDGIQVNVSVQTHAVEVSADVTLEVDDKPVGSAVHPGADGSLVFSGVTLENGDHELKAVSGAAESPVVNVSVNPNCASVSFVTPEPPENGDDLVLGGGDKCPAKGEAFTTDIVIATDAGENRDVDLQVNETTVASTKVKNSAAKFSNVVLDRRDLPNKVAVIVQNAQGVTCKPVLYPVDIKVDCDGVDCSISAPKPVAGVDASGNRVLYLNKSQRASDGFDFQVHTFSSAIGKPVKLIIDGNDLDAPTANPAGSDPNVTAKFDAVKLSEGPHTVQARCEDASGNVNFSNKTSWIVDTQACSVDIQHPSEDTLLVPAIDKDSAKAGVQTEVESKVSGNDCSGTRAAPCDPKTGIKDVAFDNYGGGANVTSTLTLANQPEQTLCVEVSDRAGNLGLDSIGVRFRVEAPKLFIETPADGDKFNAGGNDGYKKDSDTNSAAVCNADFDVACTEIGGQVKLRRGNAEGTVFATADCAQKTDGSPDLPNGYSGRAHFTNAAFLPGNPNNADQVTVVATQSLSNNGDGLVGESQPIVLKGDCQKPALSFAQDPCEGGQIAVANASSTVTKDIVVADNTTDTSNGHLAVTSGGNSVASKDATISNGTYTFTGVALGGPGSGSRTVNIEASAKDDYENTGTATCAANIVYDLPTLTVTAPANNAVFTPNAQGLCTPSGGGTGVAITGTSDSASNRSARVSVNSGADSTLTLTNTAISGCVSINEGTNTLAIKLVSTATTAVDTEMRTVIYVAHTPMNGIPLTVGNPGDRNGKVALSWTAPTQDFDGQYVSYQLRCDPQALNVDNVGLAEENAWWDGARVISLPADFKPLSDDVELDFRAGEVNNCVLRAADATGALTPIVSSASVLAPFRAANFVPASTGQAAGYDLAAIGDVNADGTDDLLVGGQGESYLVFGNTNGWSSSSSNAPDVTFVSDSQSFFGWQVVGLGDFNGDGPSDFAIADPGWNNGAGRVFVFFGRTSNDWPTTPIDLTGACGADLCFDNANVQAFGSAIEGIGDFNGDNRPDLAIGAVNFPNDTVANGRLYILVGKAYESGTTKTTTFYGLSFPVDTDPALQGFTITGDASTNFLGQSITGLGTFDNVAGTELAVSAMGFGGAAGKVFVLSGHTYNGTGLQTLALSELGVRDGNGTPSGQPIDTGASAAFGFNVVAVGNVFNLGSANRPNTVDLAVWVGFDNNFLVYLGDTNFAPADRLSFGPAAGGLVYMGESICNGRTRGDLDNDGLVELCAAGELNPAGGGAPGIGSLWYGDVIARKLGPSKTIDSASSSPLAPAAGTGVTARVVEYVGDLNKDGKQDLAIGGPGANTFTGEFTILY